MTFTIHQALTEAAETLRAAGIDTAVLDARVLLCHALGLGEEYLLGSQETPINQDIAGQYRKFVARRQQHEPIAHITHKKEFWSLDFTVTPATLVPRPESETLVESALQRFPDRDRAYEIVDFGTGSGCLLITLLRELPKSIGIGIDISTSALAVASANAKALGVAPRARFVQGDWAKNIKGAFDIIIGNPPYIAEGEINKLAPDVAKFEPHTALFGGADGLDAYRALMPQVARLLKSNGTALFEIGQGQTAGITKIIREAGLKAVEVKPDLAGIDRCIIIKKE
jgi:release factor glutamine methyltransferase